MSGQMRKRSLFVAALAWLIHQAGEVSTEVKNRLVKSSVAWSVSA